MYIELSALRIFQINFIEDMHTFLLDVDECSSNSYSCDANAVCTNVIGYYTCKCKAGYSGNGKTCSGE